MAGDHSLNEVKPREEAGAQTGALYEYQYHQAAAEALSLLDDTGSVCLYCEWHDDYVTETTTPVTCYAFHQVKTRQKSKGPWPISEFFGLKRNAKNKPEPAADSSSIFARLWDHTKKFGGRCGKFVFVSDAGIESEFKALLENAKSTQKIGDFPEEIRKNFDRIRDQTSQILDVNDTNLLAFLSRLEIREGVGSVQNLADARIVIANRISQASEVDLKLSEARKIGTDLVSAVRTRSQTVLKELPKSLADLRTSKGLVIDNILQLLSLSVEGYRQLKTGGRDSVLALSRLHRLCKRNCIASDVIPDLCKYKTGWAAWYVQERYQVNELDFVSLKTECSDLLRAHSAGHLEFGKLLAEASSLAGKYSDRLNCSQPLTGELVLGLILTIAVEAEERYEAT